MSKGQEASHHHEEEEHEHHEWCPQLDRRAALRLLSMTTLATVAGCGSSSVAASTTTNSTGTTATTTTLTSSASTVAQSATVTLTAAVSPMTATGTVTFYNGTTSLGTATLSSGTATLTTAFITSGTESLTAAYGGSATYAASTSAAVTVTVTASTTSCTATLEGEEGPYFVDDSVSGYLRSNIVSNLDGTKTQTGIPFTLTIYVYDSKNSCGTMQNVQVDIWHCSATGLYSAESVESTVGQSWLRGYQLTDVNGKVQFTTIIPGWYSGRTTHIHLRFRSIYDSTSNSGTNTNQIFFDQTLIDTISTTVAPYSTEGKNPTTNASDHVFSSEQKGTGLLTLTGSTAAGYSATFNAFMPIA
jgi:protocatechuate 3,4-dioxygenase beta subunit